MNRWPHSILYSLPILLLVCLFGLAPVAFGQQSDLSAIATQYQQARAAYSERQFKKSSELFRSVSAKCPGSELALQCEYFAVMSDWSIEPCDQCAGKLCSWLDSAKKFKSDSLAAGRSLNTNQLFQWTENAQLLHAKWDRQKQRLDLAEERLINFLGFSKASKGNEPTRSSSGWIELGSLLLENRQDYTAARDCFENAMTCCTDKDPVYRQAAMGAALACWYSHQYDDAKKFLLRLETQNLEDDLAIQSQILQAKIAKALGETIDVVQRLEPFVQLALAGSPQASTLYELAMALIESGERSNSDQLLVHLVHRFPNSSVSIEARVRLARNSHDDRDWKQALLYSKQAMEMGCPKELSPYALWIHGRASMELGDLDQAKRDLESALAHAQIDLQLQVTVRFQLAETLYQLQRWTDADQHWQWLAQFAESAPKDASKSSMPDWFPVVLLRTAELLALKKEWGEAEKIVLRIRNDFPKCNRACEVDYLLARCMVSKADFDAARGVLSGLTNPIASSPSELLARAHWMVGETYMMQRKYTDASEAYRHVLGVAEQPYWHSAALLQLGQCCEATQDGSAAEIAYNTLIRDFSDSPFAQTAKERLRQLTTVSNANQAATNLSGAKR